MRRAFFALLLLVLLLTSCKNTVTLFENHLNDLDFEYRFEELYEEVSEESENPLLLMQITKLRDEMADYTDENKRLNDINKMYVSSMDKLLLAHQGDLSQLEIARETFDRATGDFDAFKTAK